MTAIKSKQAKPVTGKRALMMATTVEAQSNKEPKSAAFDAIHSAAAGLFKVGAISRVTMRNFDKACLSTFAIDAEDIKKIREKNKLSQPVFARYLGTSESTVKQWETGAKHPSGMARTLLNAVKKHGIAVLE